MFALCLALLFPDNAPGFPPVLSTTHEVRVLPGAEAGRLVVLRGTVTFSPREYEHFYLQDDTGGVRVEWRMRNVELNPGDSVIVMGVTTAGAFVPEVRAEIVKMTPGSRDRLPKAQQVNLTTDEAYFLDAELPPPSWWTGRRVDYLTAGFLGLFLIGGATVTALRLQVRRVTVLAQKRDEENRQLEGQLDRSARLAAFERVAGGVAHDFNNILTVINGCAQILDETAADDPVRANALANIRRAGRLAVVLSRLLLAFSQHRKTERLPLDLNALIADADPILARLLGTRTVLCVAPDPNLPPAMADTGLLLQILLNLTVNAGDAMPGGGTFTLATSIPEAGWVRLTATDTGMGMIAEVQSRVFDRGFSTKPDGTGTGLATVFDAVRELGGQIRFHSELGCGTEFEVDLLAAPRDPQPAPTPDGPASVVLPNCMAERPALRSAMSPSVVMLVEDDDGVRAYVCHVLESTGLTVVAVAEPMAALRALDDPALAIELLVTDLLLPGLDGRELAARVRTRFPGIPVLFMSGHPAEEVLSARDGAVHLLHKPFTPNELTEQVSRLLGQPSA